MYRNLPVSHRAIKPTNRVDFCSELYLHMMDSLLPDNFLHLNHPFPLLTVTSTETAGLLSGHSIPDDFR